MPPSGPHATRLESDSLHEIGVGPMTGFDTSTLPCFGRPRTLPSCQHLTTRFAHVHTRMICAVSSTEAAYIQAAGNRRSGRRPPGFNVLSVISPAPGLRADPPSLTAI